MAASLLLALSAALALLTTPVAAQNNCYRNIYVGRLLPLRPPAVPS